MEGDRGSVEGQRRHHAQASSTVLAAQRGGRGTAPGVGLLYTPAESRFPASLWGCLAGLTLGSCQAHPLARVSTQSEIQPSKGLTARARITYPVGSW